MPNYTPTEIEKFKENNPTQVFGMNDNQVQKVMKLLEEQKRQKEEQILLKEEQKRQKEEQARLDKERQEKEEQERIKQQEQEKKERERLQKEWEKNSNKIIAKILADWHKFYKDEFNLDLDFSNLQIPAPKVGFDRILIIAKGLTINQVFDACSKKFKTWRFTKDLDKSVTKNDRISDKTYPIRIRDRIEADEENKNKSANQLTEENINGTTLLERLIFELKYFIETQNHLDVSNITLCSGSRHSGGDVPHVRWSGVGLNVSWYAPSLAFSAVRARVVVS